LQATKADSYFHYFQPHQQMDVAGQLYLPTAFSLDKIAPGTL
jgi:hypothetical protein